MKETGEYSTGIAAELVSALVILLVLPMLGLINQ